MVADRLHSAAIHLLRRLRTRDTESGIGPAQLSALSVLVFGGPTSLAALAAAEQVRPPTMSRVVAALVRSRLARRRIDPEDRRAVVIEPTERGRRALAAARARRLELLRELLLDLDGDELRQLSAAADAIERLSARS